MKDKEFPTIGIYAAGLDCRMTNAPITYAMINSVKDKVNDFSPFDVVIVDEAHHIPIAENGMYRTFINAARQRNPRLRIIGLTATPYRMGCGHVCHKDYILNEVCYEVRVGDLIRDGFLCLLRSRVQLIGVKVRGILTPEARERVDAFGFAPVVGRSADGHRVCEYTVYHPYGSGAGMLRYRVIEDETEPFGIYRGVVSSVDIPSPAHF